ncbi:MAG: hypothetical protein JWN86_1888 [Planctomycetota bacterium]|nr:hypothetical protein [Planctomycetota bacterium]
MPFSVRRFHVRHLLFLVALCAVVAAVISRLPREKIEALGAGSPRYATKWKAVFDAFADPEAAHAGAPEVVGRRFNDGSWLFGVASGSHGNAEGGTIVVKDSSGRVRAFFGHVCRPESLEEALGESQSTTTFYGMPGWKKFTEYAYP